MSEHVYKTIELTGSSTTGIEDAIEKAIARSDATIQYLRWFQVTDIRGHLEEGQVQHWQVTIKVGFTLDP